MKTLKFTLLKNFHITDAKPCSNNANKSTNNLVIFVLNSSKENYEKINKVYFKNDCFLKKIFY